jgi:hypothetical protein
MNNEEKNEKKEIEFKINEKKDNIEKKENITNFIEKKEINIEEKKINEDKEIARVKSKSALRRLFEKKPSQYKELFSSPAVSFDLLKVNRFIFILIIRLGIKQNRTLLISETGISNMKGKLCQWYYPIHDIHSIEKLNNEQNTISIKIIKTYTFKTSGENESNKIEEVFNELLLKKKKKKEISINDFEFITILGQGSFSKVALVLHKEKLFAMKVLLKSELQKRNQIEHTITEKHILSQFTHPFLVKLYYSFQTQDKLYMCLEFVSCGELYYHLKK